ncbi:hypothetical protein BpHYR1_008162 [Brachionus plicatilis]|uniref:Uncharacterized protein n=1 Tax=Brachionus plicatilis TaxID=10195 RepID=A0A3M7PS68_BRAPC|nr:hypothetical protein BpHYR1_008162 [Brachionus plicatilis]
MNSSYMASCGTCIAPAIIITPCSQIQSPMQGYPQQMPQFPTSYQQYPSQYPQPYMQNFSQPSTCLTSCTTTCSPNLMQSYNPPYPSYPSIYQPQPQSCFPQSQFSQPSVCQPNFQNCGPQSIIQNYPQCPPSVQCFSNYQPYGSNCLPAPGSQTNIPQERSKEIITRPYLPYSRQNRRGYPSWD